MSVVGVESVNAQEMPVPGRRSAVSHKYYPFARIGHGLLSFLGSLSHPLIPTICSPSPDPISYSSWHGDVEVLQGSLSFDRAATMLSDQCCERKRTAEEWAFTQYAILICAGTDILN